MDFERIDPVRLENDTSESDSEPPAKRRRGTAKTWTKGQEFASHEESESYMKEVYSCFVVVIRAHIHK